MVPTWFHSTFFQQSKFAPLSLSTLPLVTNFKNDCWKLYRRLNGGLLFMLMISTSSALEKSWMVLLQSTAKTDIHIFEQCFQTNIGEILWFDSWFRPHYRVSIETFRKIFNESVSKYTVSNKGRLSKSLELFVACTLIYLSSEWEQRTVLLSWKEPNERKSITSVKVLRIQKGLKTFVELLMVFLMKLRDLQNLKASIEAKVFQQSIYM